MATWTQSTAAKNAVKAAKAGVGKGSALVGWCEKWTRSCFGFSAKYASAYLAYQASKAAGGLVAGDGSDAPAGSVMFWDITSGKNAPYDHVAPVVATGVVASTSVGPNSTVGLVKITDLTKRWGMKPRGWAHIYHGQRILTKASAPAPSGSASVRAWQQQLNTYAKAGLYVDGIEGSVTKAWRAWVKEAKRYLNYYAGVSGKVTQNDKYDAAFAAQVKTVQSRNGLVQDGVIGPVMIAWMRRQGSTGMPDRPRSRP